MIAEGVWSVVGGVAAAIVSVAGLLLHLFQTRWSEKTQWLKKLKELEDAFNEADKAHEAALDGIDNDALARTRDRWVSAAKALGDHRAVGNRMNW